MPQIISEAYAQSIEVEQHKLRQQLAQIAYQEERQLPPQRRAPLPVVKNVGNGWMGMPPEVTDSTEFCNLILFIAFGIFALFGFDSLLKLAVKLHNTGA